MKTKLHFYTMTLLCICAFSTSLHAQFQDQYDYEGSTTIPANHTVTTPPNTSISIQPVSVCNTNMIELDDNAAGANAQFSMPFSNSEEIGAGEFIHCRFDIELLQTDLGIHLDLRDGGTPIIKVTFASNGNIQPFDNTTPVSVGTYAANQVYRVYIIGDWDNRKYTVSIDGVDTGLEFGFRASVGRTIDNFRQLSIGGAGTGIARIDKIVLSDSAIPGTVLPKDDAGSCPPLSIDDKSLNETVIYPNPTSDFINLKSQGEIGSAVLFDISGKSIKEIKYNATTKLIDVRSLTNGLYFLKVSQGQNQKVFKVVKQ